MAIEIHDDYIQFGDTKISQTATGISLGSKTLRTTYLNRIWEITPIQGSISGYTSGGATHPINSNTDTIDKFPFSADFQTASDVGNLTQSRGNVAGQSSETHGYTSGGRVLPYASPYTYDTIDKFPFYTPFITATDVGNLSQQKELQAGNSSATHGYNSGGMHGSTHQNTIERFPFSVDGDAADIGYLNYARNNIAGQSSGTHGYLSAGYRFPGLPSTVSEIDRFPFSADLVTAKDVGDLTVARYRSAGQSSDVSGYTSGGMPNSGGGYTLIDKFPFAHDVGSTLVVSAVGVLSANYVGAAGQSSLENGYTSGGWVPPSTYNTSIDKFPFATDANASSVGDLIQHRAIPAGQQV